MYLKSLSYGFSISLFFLSGAFLFCLGCSDSTSEKTPLAQAASAPVIVTTTLPDADVARSYQTQINATSTSTLEYILVDGATLPAGLSLSLSGDITGTPRVEGSFSFSVQVNDLENTTLNATRAYSLVVHPADIVLEPSSLPASIIGDNYTLDFNTSGGTAPYTFALTAGGTPSGQDFILGQTSLIMNDQGNISGAIIQLPTDNFFADFTVEVTDSSTPPKVSQHARRLYFLNRPSLSGKTLDNGREGDNYSYEFDLENSGELGPIRWSLPTPSHFPNGLTLGSDGVISGNPTAPGLYVFEVEAKTASVPPQTLNASYQLFIAPVSTYTHVDDNHDLPANNAPIDASSLGTLTANTETLLSSLSLGTTNDRDDYYLFSLGVSSGVTIELICETSQGLPDLKLLQERSGVYEEIAFSHYTSHGVSIVAEGLDAGDYVVQVSVGSSDNVYALRILNRDLTITTSDLDVDIANQPSISIQLNALINNNPPTLPIWNIEEGSLPTGLSIQGDTLAGTPLEKGLYPISLKVEEAGSSAVRDILLRIYDSTEGDYWELLGERVNQSNSIEDWLGPAVVHAPAQGYNNGALWLLGGNDNSGTSSSAIRIYHTEHGSDPNKNYRFETLAPAMNSARRYFSATFVQHTYGGYIYAVGGENVTIPGTHSGGDYLLSCERLRVADGAGDPVALTAWENVASMPSVAATGEAINGRAEYGLAVNDNAADNLDRLYLFGGRTQIEDSPGSGIFQKSIRDDILMFACPLNADTSVDDGEWFTKTDTLTGRRFPAIAMIDGAIFIAGGRTSSNLNTIEMYRPNPTGALPAIETAPSTGFPLLPEALYFSASGAQNGELYLVGGWNNGFSATIHTVSFKPSIDQRSGKLQRLSGIDHPHGFGQGAFHEGQFYVLTGLDHFNTNPPLVLRYYPKVP